MQRTLSEHLLIWERIEMLKKGLQDPERTISEKQEMKIDLGIAERALANFQKAFALEKRLSDSVRRFKGGNQFSRAKYVIAGFAQEGTNLWKNRFPG